MIHGNHSTLQMPTWQNQLAKAIKDPEQLLNALNLPLKHLPAMQIAHQMFPLRVTQSFLSRIEKGNIHDPLLRQILPCANEAKLTQGYSNDPVGDKAAETEPGLLHKYKNRVLLTLTAACAIHCRYCFRRHFDYSASNPIKDWLKNIHYIERHPEVNEVIFSGGDPLSISDQRLAPMIREIAAIPHVNTLRIHTRQVIVLPERIDKQLLKWASIDNIKIVFVVHINHPNEIDAQVESAISQLANAGVTLLNQSVIMQGVNNSTKILSELSTKLFSIGILPYYIHLLDKVQGAAHFEVSESEAKLRINELRKELPGYLVPKLVKEEANEPNKTPIT